MRTEKGSNLIPTTKKKRFKHGKGEREGIRVLVYLIPKRNKKGGGLAHPNGREKEWEKVGNLSLEAHMKEMEPRKRDEGSEKGPKYFL